MHPVPKNKAEVAALSLRVALGAWFTYSGGLKIFVTGLDKFTRDVANYKLVAARVEVIGGLCLMLGILRKGTLLAMTGLVATFAVAVGWAWSKNLDISCGCHGGDAKLSYWTKAAELGAYFVAFGWLWYMEVRSRRS